MIYSVPSRRQNAPVNLGCRRTRGEFSLPPPIVLDPLQHMTSFGRHRGSTTFAPMDPIGTQQKPIILKKKCRRHEKNPAVRCRCTFGDKTGIVLAFPLSEHRFRKTGTPGELTKVLDVHFSFPRWARVLSNTTVARLERDDNDSTAAAGRLVKNDLSTSSTSSRRLE